MICGIPVSVAAKGLCPVHRELKRLAGERYRANLKTRQRNSTT